MGTPPQNWDPFYLDLFDDNMGLDAGFFPKIDEDALDSVISGTSNAVNYIPSTEDWAPMVVPDEELSNAKERSSQSITDELQLSSQTPKQPTVAEFSRQLEAKMVSLAHAIALQKQSVENSLERAEFLKGKYEELLVWAYRMQGTVTELVLRAGLKPIPESTESH